MDGGDEVLRKGKMWVEADRVVGPGTEHSSNTPYSFGFGQVPQAMTKGVAVAVIWPPTQWSW